MIGASGCYIDEPVGDIEAVSLEVDVSYWEDKMSTMALDPGAVLVDVQLRASSDSIPPIGVRGYELIGYWDVDSVVANASRGTDGSTGHYMMSMFAKWAVNPTDGCITDIRLTVSDANNAPEPSPGFTGIGQWDVDSGGGVGTDGGLAYFMMGMYVKKGFSNCVRDLQTRASNFSQPRLISGYQLRGYWDVDSSDVVLSSRGTDGSVGHNIMSLLYLK